MQVKDWVNLMPWREFCMWIRRHGLVTLWGLTAILNKRMRCPFSKSKCGGREINTKDFIDHIVKCHGLNVWGMFLQEILDYLRRHVPSRSYLNKILPTGKPLDKDDTFNGTYDGTMIKIEAPEKPHTEYQRELATRYEDEHFALGKARIDTGLNVLILQLEDKIRNTDRTQLIECKQHYKDETVAAEQEELSKLYIQLYPGMPPPPATDPCAGMYNKDNDQPLWVSRTHAFIPEKYKDRQNPPDPVWYKQHPRNWLQWDKNFCTIQHLEEGHYAFPAVGHPLPEVQLPQQEPLLWLDKKEEVFKGAHFVVGELVVPDLAGAAAPAAVKTAVKTARKEECKEVVVVGEKRALSDTSLVETSRPSKRSKIEVKKTSTTEDHTRKKRYQCRLCDLVFDYSREGSKALTVHYERIHLMKNSIKTNEEGKVERWFACDKCDQSFTDLSQLDDHQMSSHYPEDLKKQEKKQPANVKARPSPLPPAKIVKAASSKKSALQIVPSPTVVGAPTRTKVVFACRMNGGCSNLNLKWEGKDATDAFLHVIRHLLRDDWKGLVQNPLHCNQCKFTAKFKKGNSAMKAAEMALHIATVHPWSSGKIQFNLDFVLDNLEKTEVEEEEEEEI